MVIKSAKGSKMGFQQSNLLSKLYKQKDIEVCIES